MSGSGPGAPTLSQVTALLARHSSAVTDHSAVRFLDDVDRAGASATFRASQTAQIAALQALPLASWNYSVSSTVTDQSILQAAATRLDAPTLIVHLTLSYALAGVDAEPVAHDLWWTFVQRHGHVYAAGANDMSGQGGTSWQGPWDFGPIVVQRGISSLVIGHPADAGQLASLSAAVDAAVPQVSAVWGTDWARTVAVIVPASITEYDALSGANAQGSLSDVSAQTVLESTSDSKSGARIIMNPAVLATLTPVGRQIVVRHELTHVATAAVTTIGTPTWLVEGFADYVGNLDSGQSVRTAAAELRAEVSHGQLPDSLPSDQDFAATTGLAAVYEESWLACRLIAARAGQVGLVRFYTNVAESAQTISDAVSAAVAVALHESVTTFVQQWRAYLRMQLG